MAETIASQDLERKIKQVIAVMSGKGGVGKSVVSGLLALALQREGLRVGVLDGDLTCPSIARMFGVEDQLPEYSDGIEPLVSETGIKITSMTMFVEDKSEPLVWRGPMVSSAFKQLYSEVEWGQLDYLLVDVPPGTSDVPMTVLQSLPLEGVIIVSSPQVIATTAVKKCIKMVHQLKGNIVGVIENMAYFKTPEGECYEVFGPSTADQLVAMAGAPLLGRLPIDPKLTALCDAGRIEEYSAEAYDSLGLKFLMPLEIKR